MKLKQGLFLKWSLKNNANKEDKKKELWNC